MKLSIITANINNEHGLERTMLSVFNQTVFKDIEYIIVDGNSIDNSLQVINKYKDKDFSCIVSKGDNIFSLMNDAIKFITGDYVLFLNSGNSLIDNNIIEYIYKNNYNEDVILFNQINKIGKEEQLFYPKSKIEYNKVPLNILIPIIQKFPFNSILFKKNLFDKIKFDNLKIHSDKEFCLETLFFNKHTYKFVDNMICTVNKSNLEKIYHKLSILENCKLYTKLIRKYNKPVKYMKEYINSYKGVLNRKPSDNLNIDIDYVFTFVDNTDKEWQKQYEIAAKENNIKYSFNCEAFTNWDLLKYHLRGIEKNLPFIHNVYMVVASETQIPDWLDTTKINIVYHRDIIPEEFLPTFNSCTIELFLHNIKGLSEYFIYGNDDMYSMNRMYKSDFFSNDLLPKLSIETINFNKRTETAFFHNLADTANNIREWLNIKKEKTILQSNHSLTVFRKSFIQELYDNHKEELHNSCTAFRDNAKNRSQWVWLFYEYLSDKCSLDYSLVCQYKEVINPDILSVIKRGDTDILCINDGAQLSNESFIKVKEFLINAFELRFNIKSKYEI